MSVSNKEAFVSLVLVIICVSIVFYFPLLFIWSLNNLFNLEIPYNWKTWLSTYILLTILNLGKAGQKETKLFWK